jgi:hypothetical protein
VQPAGEVVLENPTAPTTSPIVIDAGDGSPVDAPSGEVHEGKERQKKKEKKKDKKKGGRKEEKKEKEEEEGKEEAEDEDDEDRQESESTS